MNKIVVVWTCKMIDAIVKAYVSASDHVGCQYVLELELFCVRGSLEDIV